MAHRLTQQFLTLVTIKGVVMGYAQWAGALVEPTALPLTMLPSSLGNEVLLVHPIDLETLNP